MPESMGDQEYIDHLEAEVERLTEVARLAQMQSDQAVCVADEGIAEVERLTADLAAARAERDGLAKALATSETRHARWVRA